MRAGALLLGLAALAGCSALPRDPEGTTERVQASKVIRLGVASGVRSPEAAELVHRLEAQTGARARQVEGGTEPLLASLEKGRLDLVIATFDEQTPWKSRVALAPPLGLPAASAAPVQLRAAVRNGENRWAMLVETTSRAVAPEPKR